MNCFSNLWSVKLSDGWRALIVAILTGPLTIIYESVTAVPMSLTFNWKVIIGSALAGGIGYLLKNFFTGINGKVLSNKIVLFASSLLGVILWANVAMAMNVTLAWDPNSETDLAGYKVYYGAASGGPYNGAGASGGNSPITVPLGSLANQSLPEYSVNNMPNQTWYFVLTAYDTEGLESGYSNQVSATPPVVQYVLTAGVTGGNGTVAPASGTYNSGTTVTLTASPNSGYRVLAWTGTANDTLKTNTNTVVMSANKTVTVSFELVPIAPTITAQPQNASKNVGQTATFTVVATGIPVPTYQWQSRPNAVGTWATVATATNSSYTTAILAAGDNGRQYRCVITNSAGSVTSATAVLIVNAPPSMPTNLHVLP